MSCRITPIFILDGGNMDFEMLEKETNGTVIKVVGVGGAGGNAVQHMINRGVQGVDFIVMNTDAQALARSRATTVIQLGNTGLGAGAKPDMGKAAAEDARERIADALRGAHMVFITAGMGGGTGTGAGVDRARLAAEQAVASPLLEGVDLSGARGVLVNITSSRSLRLSETREVMNTIKSYAAEDATVIFGAVYDDAMGDALRVTVVATGLGRAAKKQQSAPMTLLRTGTDNQPVSAHAAYAP